MENRTLIVADEFFGARGEAAELFSQLLLCLEPERPRQFIINAPFYGSLASLQSKIDIDIVGKQAWRLIFGVGLRELRQGVKVQSLFARFREILLEVTQKMRCEIYVVTLPESAFPEEPSVVNHWNSLLKTLENSNIFLLDFANAESEFQRKQAARGKFSRTLWEDSGNLTSIGLMFLALFLQKNFINIGTPKACIQKEAQ